MFGSMATATRLLKTGWISVQGQLVGVFGERNSEFTGLL